MPRWISLFSNSSKLRAITPQPSKPQAEPRTLIASSFLSFTSQNVTKISVEIPSYKIEAANFNVGYEVDLEKMGSLAPNSLELPPNYSHPIPCILYTSNTTNDIDALCNEDVIEKPPFRHRLFDLITRHAGSRYVLLITVILLLIWIFFGVAFGPTDIWQIAMQNASSIQVYLTDILLIRQQYTSSRSLLTTLSRMQSRHKTFARLIKKNPAIPPKASSLSKEANSKIRFISSKPAEISSLSSLVSSETNTSKSKAIFDESCRIIAVGLGSVWAYIIYWTLIFIWIGTGKSFEFSDTWQLYINTVVAVALTFTSIFLQNRQQQQEDTLDLILQYSTKIDREIEFWLRQSTGDMIPNEVVSIETPTLGWIEKGVDLFARMMGSLTGVVITLVFFIIWIIIGPLLLYSADWWLIIGTFTGLIGFIDSVFLRNIYARDAQIVNQHLSTIASLDDKILSHANLNLPLTCPHPCSNPQKHTSLPTKYSPNNLSTSKSRSSKISAKIGSYTASPAISLASVLFVILLLVIASAMRWSTRAQLLCNTPTMIVEGFWLLVLIEAHCASNEVREGHLAGVLERRLILSRGLREREVMVERGREKEVEVRSEKR